MVHKVHYFFEAVCALLVIQLQPIIGGLASAVMIIYYISKLKIDVVDKKHSGSWKHFFKSIINRKK